MSSCALMGGAPSERDDEHLGIWQSMRWREGGGSSNHPDSGRAFPRSSRNGRTKTVCKGTIGFLGKAAFHIIVAIDGNVRHQVSPMKALPALKNSSSANERETFSCS